MLMMSSAISLIWLETLESFSLCCFSVSNPLRAPWLNCWSAPLTTYWNDFRSFLATAGGYITCLINLIWLMTKLGIFLMSCYLASTTVFPVWIDMLWHGSRLCRNLASKLLHKSKDHMTCLWVSLHPLPIRPSHHTALFHLLFKFKMRIECTFIRTIYKNRLGPT